MTITLINYLYMLLTYILFVLKFLVKSPKTHSHRFLITDYYESLSNPRKCLVVSHYYPTLPLFLYFSFTYKLYSFIYGYVSKNIDINIYFKRLDRKCNNSFIFFTIFKDFKKLDLLILTFLFKYKDALAIIDYTFYQGISNGIYKLSDLDQNFHVHVKIDDDNKNYIVNSIRSANEIISYLNSTSQKPENLCLITENNNFIVLTPDYGLLNPNGYITNFKAELFRNEMLVSSCKYVAFNCLKNQVYSNEPAIFIIDQPKFDIIFKVTTRRYSKGKPVSTEYKFKIHNPSYIYIDDMQYIPQSYNKAFLVNSRIGFILCQDGTERIKFSSNNDIIYYVEECKQVNINSSLECQVCISHSLMDQC